VVDIDSLVNVERAWQSRRIFWDRELYELELERVFGRCWLFLGHESQLAAPGDFLTTYMGEDAVLVTRHSDGSYRAMLNTCSHRGNKVCFADSGNARTFTCNYHGWTYGTDGALSFVPLEQECYQNRLDKGRLGLQSVAQVDSYKGLIFGTFDPEAPPLIDYLGEMAWYLDVILDASPAGTEFLGPPMKCRIPCNWKLAAENFVGDGYHVGWTHAAALRLYDQFQAAGLSPGNAELDDSLGIQVTTKGGHGFDNPLDGRSGYALFSEPGRLFDYLEKTRPRVIERLGERRGTRFYGSNINSTIFPNFSFLGGGINTFRVWHPRGAEELEVWIWALVEKDMPSEVREAIRDSSPRLFGVAGVFEPDDAENFENATRLTRGYFTKRRRAVLNMDLGAGRPHPEMPGRVSGRVVGEMPQRGFYTFWRQLMRSKNWQEVGFKPTS
jgi:ethylbenzene dioxygenase subunit alpha